MALLTRKNKKKKKERKRFLYKDCSDISIYNFDQIYKTENYMYLVVGYDGYKDVKIPDGYKERWKEIKDEWISLIDDNSVTYYYQLVLEVAYLQSRYDVSGMLLHQVWIQDMDSETLNSYIKVLKLWGYKYNKSKDKADEVNRLMLQRKSSENKLSIKSSELKKLREEHEDKEVSTLEQQALIIEQATGIKINIKKDSVTTWVSAIKLAEKTNENKKKKK